MADVVSPKLHAGQEKRHPIRYQRPCLGRLDTANLVQCQIRVMPGELRYLIERAKNARHPPWDGDVAGRHSELTKKHVL